MAAPGEALSKPGGQRAERVFLQAAEKLEAAHRVIQEHLLNPGPGWIPYKKGSRAYTPEEHLDVVNRHILAHLRDIHRLAGMRGD